ncbi:hypothetical protein EV127DRAFT_468867 [Xylaria flabelliformis]|nr:hypothetical protein EV127DRAFT_468867 [Xylaria flabelliformis]
MHPTDYTVGWICAVEVELVAAEALLDEEHDTLDHIPVNDNNSYTLGRSGKHNIVIAVMPHRQYGLVSASNVARDMVRSFPNVRIGLMVGIGGGAPSIEHDIRLGDIVVCSPGYENGGVLQYDYGKIIQDKSFEITGNLNQPPQFMLTAMASLKSKYKRLGHNFNTTIQATLDKNRRLRLDYCRPDPITDKLYDSDWTHKGRDKDECETVCGNHRLKIRAERSDHEENPKIHYGLIASANQLMKDALIRDKLLADKDVLCFEMEAAGLMNHFPCLVIRGICDYSDTHKNDSWQGYAAMAAAAYAKDLLAKITPNQVEAQRKLGEILLDVQEDVKEVKTEIGGLRAETHFDHINKWLLPPDPSTNLNDALKLRHQGSGEWFLHHPAYSDWKCAGNSFLWLYGIPGCGKTILSAAIIADLATGELNQCLLYFHFDFSDTRKQSFDMMLRSLLWQLYYNNTDVRSRLDSLYLFCCKRSQQPSLELLQAAFLDMIKKVQEVWIILDALDECPTRTEYPTGGLLSWIQNLHSSQVNTHLIITSRPEQDIEASIKSMARIQDIIPIQTDLVQEDIGAYVRARVREHGTLSERWCGRSDIQDMIENTLKERANGIECLGPPQIRKALAELPETLEETYSRIVNNLPSEYLPTATRLLQFLTYSKRPLSLEEAVDCIAVDTNTRMFDPADRMPVPKEISRYCSSLVVIVERACDNGKKATATEIQLAHYSVKEYLSNSPKLPHKIAKHLMVEMASESITNVCLTYLLGTFHDNSDGQPSPLAKYAAQYWTIHARAVNHSESLVKLILDFFAHQEAFEACYQLFPIDEIPQKGLGIPSCLYYAASAGLTQLIQPLLDIGGNVNSPGGNYCNALQAASARGHESIIRILLDNGADVHAQKGYRIDALQIASIYGHESIVQILLDNGADVNARAGVEGSALQAASARGYESIVRILLDNGAKVNSQEVNRSNALQIASIYGHESIVQILLDNGADVNARTGHYGNALQAASFCGRESVVRILLDNGADVNAHGGFYGNALRVASMEGYEGIVRILVNHGISRCFYNDAIKSAKSWRHYNIARMLQQEFKSARHGEPTQESRQIPIDLTTRASSNTTNPSQLKKRSTSSENTIEPPRKRARIRAP